MTDEYSNVALAIDLPDFLSLAKQLGYSKGAGSKAYHNILSRQMGNEPPLPYGDIREECDLAADVDEEKEVAQKTAEFDLQYERVMASGVCNLYCIYLNAIDAVYIVSGENGIYGAFNTYERAQALVNTLHNQAQERSESDD